jgi:hypothetical protein
MSAVATIESPKPISNLEIATAFANKTIQVGEKVDVRVLWDNHFRINFWSKEKGNIIRSIFVRISGGNVEIPDKQ